MSKFDKLLLRLLSTPKDFTYDQLKRLLRSFGYEEEQGAGSRVVFVNEKLKHNIKLHKPHPAKILKRYQIEIVIEELKGKGLL